MGCVEEEIKVVKKIVVKILENCQQLQLDFIFSYFQFSLK